MATLQVTRMAAEDYALAHHAAREASDAAHQADRWVDKPHSQQLGRISHLQALAQESQRHADMHKRAMDLHGQAAAMIQHSPAAKPVIDYHQKKIEEHRQGMAYWDGHTQKIKAGNPNMFTARSGDYYRSR